MKNYKGGYRKKSYRKSSNKKKYKKGNGSRNKMRLKSKGTKSLKLRLGSRRYSRKNRRGGGGNNNVNVSDKCSSTESIEMPLKVSNDEQEDENGVKYRELIPEDDDIKCIPTEFKAIYSSSTGPPSAPPQNDPGGYLAADSKDYYSSLKVEDGKVIGENLLLTDFKIVEKEEDGVKYGEVSFTIPSEENRKQRLKSNAKSGKILGESNKHDWWVEGIDKENVIWKFSYNNKKVSNPKSPKYLGSSLIKCTTMDSDINKICYQTPEPPTPPEPENPEPVAEPVAEPQAKKSRGFGLFKKKK